MNVLAEHLDVTPRNITALVDGLEREGLVARERHPSDRRATVIHLTPAGVAVTDAWWEDHLDRTSEIFEELDPADREQLLRLVELLEVAFAKRTGSGASGAL